MGSDRAALVRYMLLLTFAHALIREFALECGYSASGIAEQIYASSGGAPMAGIMLYTAAPDSEGTLGGLVAVGKRDRLGSLIETDSWTLTPQPQSGSARPISPGGRLVERPAGECCQSRPVLGRGWHRVGCHERTVGRGLGSGHDRGDADGGVRAGKTPGDLRRALFAAGLEEMEGGGRLQLRPFPTPGPRITTNIGPGLRSVLWPRAYADLRTAGVRGEDAADHLREEMSHG